MARKQLGAAPSGSTDAATKGYVDSQTLVLPSSKTTNYTLVLGDGGTAVEMTNAAAITLTVPPDSSVAFPVGTIIEVAQLGAGPVTVTAGAGVILQSADGLVKTRAQYSAVSLRKRATDSWLLAGDLA